MITFGIMTAAVVVFAAFASAGMNLGLRNSK